MANTTKLDLVRETLRQKGVDSAVLCDPFSITWASGYPVPFMTGPSPFEAAVTVAYITPDSATLIVPDAMEGVAADTGFAVEIYPSYVVDEPASAFAVQAEIFNMVVSPSQGKVGYEGRWLPINLFKSTPSLQNGVDLGDWTDQARRVKFPEELERLRASFRLCSVAQEAGKLASRIGASELEIWSAQKRAMEIAAGDRVSVLCDLVVGQRTAEIGGPPSTNTVSSGDFVISDMVPRLNGYWGDSCNTWAVGPVNDQLKKMWRAVENAQKLAGEMIKPGLRAQDLDTAIRASLEKEGLPVYPHHTGHGVGVGYHEEPRIVPYDTGVLQIGEVIMIEPGCYIEGVAGVRLEHGYLVTADGNEQLTDYKFELE